MISKQKIKFISSLRHNKYRLKFNCFIAEGEHVVNSFMCSDFQIESVFATKHGLIPINHVMLPLLHKRK